jgi:glycine/D-amino acid oxidase-like deaminating enzyme
LLSASKQKSQPLCRNKSLHRPEPLPPRPADRFSQPVLSSPTISRTALDSEYDAVIIGGGFYGCCLALSLAGRLPRILVVEREPELLTRASYANQARVHNGYHYPRSLLTAMRSAANYPRFIKEFEDCVDRSFLQIYAIARGSSKVTAYQFRKFCEQVRIPVRPAPPSIAKLFNPALIEAAFSTEECAFNASKLRTRMLTKLQEAGVSVACNQEVDRIVPDTDGSIRTVLQDGSELKSTYVFNCTYSHINQVLARSGLPRLPLKHETTELAIVELPDPLKQVGVTVMDGPFFSTMPFPALGLHSLSHVRYTPHESWSDFEHGDSHHANTLPRSNAVFMVKDAQRYLPAIREARVVQSLFQTKTVLLQNEVDDGRPILCRADHGIKNLFVILGAKIDNIYDILETLEARHFERRPTYETCY